MYGISGSPNRGHLLLIHGLALQVREQEFTLREPLSLSVCTWNVGAKKPPSVAGEMGGWLQVGHGTDMYAVGLQVMRIVCYV